MSWKRLTLLTLCVALMVGFVAYPVLADAGRDGPNCDEIESVDDLKLAIEEYGAQDYDADDDGIACEGTPIEYMHAGEKADDIGKDDAAPQPTGEGEGDDGDTPTPNRIDTGGGYCATHDC